MQIRPPRRCSNAPPQSPPPATHRRPVWSPKQEFRDAQYPRLPSHHRQKELPRRATVRAPEQADVRPARREGSGSSPPPSLTPQFILFAIVVAQPESASRYTCAHRRWVCKPLQVIACKVVGRRKIVRRRRPSRDRQYDFSRTISWERHRNDWNCPSRLIQVAALIAHAADAPRTAWD